MLSREKIRLFVLLGLICQFLLTSLASAQTSPVTTITADLSSLQLPKDLGMAKSDPATREVSAWQESEKKFFNGILKTGQYDVLLVPCQVQDYAIDRIGRSLMTRYLHERLASTNRRLPDPTLVARALGEMARTYDLQEIYQLANALHVKQLIIPYVGHGPSIYQPPTYEIHSELNITVLLQEPDSTGKFSASGTVTRIEQKGLPFSDTLLPSEVFRAQLDDLFRQTNVKLDRLPKPKKYKSVGPVQIPSTPMALLQDRTDSPIINAYRLQLFGMLFPADSPARDGLFERSLVALLQVAPDSPDYPLLKARALLHLERRPAALVALDTPKTPEGKVFLAFMNGDLITMQKTMETIQSPLAKLLAQIEFNDLRWTYSHEPISETSEKQITANFPEWRTLIDRRLLQSWTWLQQPNIYVKDQMDKAFPIEEFTARSLATSRIAVGESPLEGAEIELCAFEHYRRYLSKQGLAKFDSRTNQPIERDYLDLLYKTSESNLVNSLSLSIILRGIPEEGLEKLERYEKVYQGHPEMTSLRRSALSDQLRKETNNEVRVKLSQEIEKLNRNAALWRMQPRYVGLTPEFDEDLPPRHYLSPNVNLKFTHTNANSYAHDSFDSIEVLYRMYINAGDQQSAEELLEQNRHRFAGHPDRLKLLAGVEEKKGNIEAAIQLYRDTIAVLPTVWDFYRELAKLQLKSGQLQEACSTFRSYPPFADKEPKNSVALSNYAFFAGWELLKQGGSDEARIFFQLTANYDTGSAAELDAQYYLELLDANYQQGTLQKLKAVKRYQQGSDYEDYINLLHVMGLREEARAIFSNLDQRRFSPHVWNGALVGLRMDGKTTHEILEWVKSNLKEQMNGAFLLNQMIDHAPEPELQQLMKDKVQPGEWTSYLTFAETYDLVRTKQFKQVVTTLDKTSGKVIDPNLLSYMVMSCRMTNQTVPLSSILKEHLKFKGDDFDYRLAQAILAGLDNRHEMALEHLNAAWRRLPSNKDRHLPSLFQLSETCEWLYEQTRDPRYLDNGLKFAKLHQMIKPTIAWAYAYEAKWTTSETDRRRALGTTMYLDRTSLRIEAFPQNEKDAALEAFMKNNPFARKETDSKKTSL